jgi:hypothetical protein
MLGFFPKLPVENEERLWVDEGFGRLEKMLGRSRMLEAKMILPDLSTFLIDTTRRLPRRKIFFSGYAPTCR